MYIPDGHGGPCTKLRYFGDIGRDPAHLMTSISNTRRGRLFGRPV